MRIVVIAAVLLLLLLGALILLVTTQIDGSKLLIVQGIITDLRTGNGIPSAKVRVQYQDEIGLGTSLATGVSSATGYVDLECQVGYHAEVSGFPPLGFRIGRIKPFVVRVEKSGYAATLLSFEALQPDRKGGSPQILDLGELELAPLGGN